MATHSSVLTPRIPGTAEPGGLPSMGSQSWTRLKRLSSSSSRSMVLMNLLTEQQWRCRHREQAFMDKGRGEEGEGEMSGESSTDA